MRKKYRNLTVSYRKLEIFYAKEHATPDHAGPRAAKKEIFTSKNSANCDEFNGEKIISLSTL